MPESTQHKLDRVRPPRVQITYDVEVGGAIQMKELPLVVGILADLCGQQDKVARLKERKFVQIDRDNFNDVMANLAPKLKYTVPNKITNEGKLAVELSFKNLDDFHPTQVLKQIDALRRLLETRQRLVDLLAKLDGNEDLHAVLHRIMGDLQGLKEAKRLAAPRQP
jgi:type VI secretion system protein ImpB